MNAAVCHRVARSLSGRAIWMEPHAFMVAVEGIAPKLGLSRAAAEAEGQTFGEQKRAAVMERLATIIECEPVDVANGMGEYGLTAGGVAVIPVVGTLVNRYDWLAAWCGLVSYDSLALTVETAARDPRVRAILLDIDSPGGEAAGMLDCADRLRKVGAEKPVWASANTLAASAGYGLAAAAGRITLPRLATVGSIGVVAIHVDQSAADEKWGLRYTPLYSGARKIDGWGHAPLDDRARQRFQARLDKSRLQFATAVAGFRRMEVEAVLATEAGVFDDDDAKAAGLADAVQPFAETLAELTEQARSGGTGPRGASAAQPTTAQEAPMGTNTPPAAGASAAASEDTKDKAEKTPGTGDDTERENEDGEDTGAGKEKPAALVSRADAAQIATLCAEAGVPALAAELIAAGASVEEAKTRIGAVSEIRAMAEAAGKVNPGAVDAAFVERLVKKGSVSGARKALFDRLTARQSAEIDATVAPDAAPAASAAGGWDKAVATVNATAGFARQ